MSSSDSVVPSGIYISYRPQEFNKSQSYLESSDDESRVGKMPPSDPSDEETYSV